MSETIPVPKAWAANARVDDIGYRSMHAAALADPEAFWGHHGQRLDWIRPFTQVKDCSFHEADFRIRWFGDGVLNVAANCIDRHLAERGVRGCEKQKGEAHGGVLGAATRC